MLNKAYIDLQAIRKNALTVKEKLNRGVKFCAVVKADAYGHGAEIVANALYKIVDCFAVSLLEEGVSLRQSGIDKEILCLIPFDKNETDRAVYYDITPTVYKKEHIYALEKSAKKLNKSVTVHIKYNTGMNRQGIDSFNELKDFITLCLAQKHIKIGGFYSHFAKPENKSALKRQLDKFLLANKLIKGYNNNITCHISASGGFLQGVQLDMVRIGILLYGYKPFESDIEVNPAMKVYAPVIQTRRLRKGEGALYGLKESKENLSLSLIRYGYADGLERKEIFSQFNNSCMDITAVKGLSEKKFYPVMIDAKSLADSYGTISYEVLTKSAIRAEKIYLN